MHSLLQHYAKLTEFLGHTLGPDYEVVLHDMTDKNHSIIAIANNHVSGREIGAPLTDAAQKALLNRNYEMHDYQLNYRAVSINGKTLRSSTLFIKHNEELIGMLCINFNDSRYQAISSSVLQLCHPDAFVETHFQFDKERITPPAESTVSPAAVSEPISSADDSIARHLNKLGVTASRLTSSERIRIIAALEEEGFFQFKGAVKEVAEALHCSQASVYRYLSHTKKD